MIIDDHFKLYLSDVGLLLSMLQIKYNDIILDNLLQYKGIIAENYVSTQFVAGGHPLIYWESQNNAEIDFILYNDDGIIPVEAKAKEHTNTIVDKTFFIIYPPFILYLYYTNKFILNLYIFYIMNIFNYEY